MTTVERILREKDLIPALLEELDETYGELRILHGNEGQGD